MANRNLWSCSHGHSKETHPSCYERELLDSEKYGYLDLECNGLFADWNVMLSWSLLIDGIIYQDVINKNDLKQKDGYFDKRITQTLINCIRDKKVTWIVTYFGTGFDLKFIRSKCVKYNIRYPVTGTIKHLDMYYICRNKLKLTSNRLANVTQFLGIKGKTPIAKSCWIKSLTGDEDALSEILRHNKFDVIILEKLHIRMIGYISKLRRSI